MHGYSWYSWKGMPADVGSVLKDSDSVARCSDLAINIVCVTSWHRMCFIMVQGIQEPLCCTFKGSMRMNSDGMARCGDLAMISYVFHHDVVCALSWSREFRSPSAARSRDLSRNWTCTLGSSSGSSLQCPKTSMVRSLHPHSALALSAWSLLHVFCC